MEHHFLQIIILRMREFISLMNQTVNNFFCATLCCSSVHGYMYAHVHCTMYMSKPLHPITNLAHATVVVYIELFTFTLHTYSVHVWLLGWLPRKIHHYL